MTPSKSFVNSIRGLDPLLSVYWGEHIHQWVIARKNHVPESELGYMRSRRNRLAGLIPTFDGHPNQLEKMKNTWASLSEEIRTGENGKRIVLFARNLTPQVYDALVLSDMSRYGGYSRLADEMEDAEERLEKEIERKQSEQRQAMNKEAYDMLNFIWRKKEEKLLAGERDMQYMLHGKRTEPDAPPLIQITDF